MNPWNDKSLQKKNLLCTMALHEHESLQLMKLFSHYLKKKKVELLLYPSSAAQSRVLSQASKNQQLPWFLEEEMKKW